MLGMAYDISGSLRQEEASATCYQVTVRILAIYEIKTL